MTIKICSYLSFWQTRPVRICGADLNGDDLRISRSYLRISDHCTPCRVTVRVRGRGRVLITVRLGNNIETKENCRVRVADCYAALLPRRGRILRRTLSVCPSVCRPSVCPSVRPSRYCFCLLYSRTVLRANIQNRKNFCFRLWASVTYALFGTHRGPHIVRPSRPHKFLLYTNCCRK